ncbi:DUF1206 domain-containing protein [Paracoccus beibuensis]|uniref:DUF1206 domain-containing protein n=1 Tax=Paracoccus beibuensis TaxID=547602 RepID=UPI0038996A51
MHHALEANPEGGFDRAWPRHRGDRAALPVRGLAGDPQSAGGAGEAFWWLSNQVYGRVLVVAVCIGPVGFAIFPFYRIIPKASGPDTETLAARPAR